MKEEKNKRKETEITIKEDEPLINLLQNCVKVNEKNDGVTDIEKVTEEEALAYAEIDNILNYAEKKYYQRVPEEVILFFKNNALENYEYYDEKYTPRVSPLARRILSYLNQKYFSLNDEKESLIKKYEDEQKLQNKKQQMEDIEESTEEVEKNMQLIVRENWLQKIIKKIKLWWNKVK